MPQFKPVKQQRENRQRKSQQSLGQGCNNFYNLMFILLESQGKKRNYKVWLKESLKREWLNCYQILQNFRETEQSNNKLKDTPIGSFSYLTSEN